MKQLPAGVRAPDFELKTIADQSFRLSSVLRDGPVALVFYKAACPTCQFTLPYLERAGNPRIWGISQDEPDVTKAFAVEFGVRFPILIDEHPYEVSRAYDLEYVPAIFIVGTDGMIQFSDYGFSKAAVSRVAGFEMFPAADGIPATRPG